MIRSLADVRAYREADLRASNLNPWRWWHNFQQPVMRFQRKLRWTEYVVNCLKGKFWAPYRAYSRRSLRLAGMKLGFTISANIFGPGLSIAHWGTIVVNPDCRVGKNCRIHPGVCLGWYKGRVPQVGDDCYLGPGAKLYGDAVLGNRVHVGPNAVVRPGVYADGLSLVAPDAVPLVKGPVKVQVTG